MYWGVCFVLSTVVSPGLSCVCGLGPFLTIFSLQTAGTVNMSGIITNVPFCCPVKTITLKKKRMQCFVERDYNSPRDSSRPQVNAEIHAIHHEAAAVI